MFLMQTPTKDYKKNRDFIILRNRTKCREFKKFIKKTFKTLDKKIEKFEELKETQNGV